MIIFYEIIRLDFSKCPTVIDFGLVPITIFTKNNLLELQPLQSQLYHEVQFQTSPKDLKLNASNNQLSLLGKDNHLLAAFLNHRCQFE